MDNLTHTLIGLAMSRAGGKHWCAYATPVLLVSANIPDLDIVTGFPGSLAYLKWHRNLTHSFLLMPVMALLSLVLVRIFARRDFPWRRLFVLALAGLLSHLLLDWTNSYGIRFLLPFSAHWYRLDITNVIDVWLWAVLLIAAITPPFARLVNAEIGAKPGSGRAIAIFALAFVLCYDFSRFLLHQRAVNMMESRIYAGAEPRGVTATPGAIDPRLWTGIVETERFFSVQPVDVLADFDPERGRLLYKAEPGAALDAARATPVFKAFLNFAQLPYWRVLPVDQPENGTKVEVSDLRFGTPPQQSFAATALLDSSLKVERAWVHFGMPSFLLKRSSK